MSNLYLCPDDFWYCPIDNNHRVLAKRFQYHIRRCMIANPHIQRVRCVFNASHLTTPTDLLNHMSTCPDAINTSTVLFGLSDIRSSRPQSDDYRRSPSPPTNWQMFHDVNATEDWDDDIREKRARSAASNEQMLISPMIQSSMSTLRVHQYIQENLERDDHEERKTTSKTPTNPKQAHVFKEYDKDRQSHPVQTDELTQKLMKIRTLQLIGGAGRGACCLLPPQPGFHERK